MLQIRKLSWFVSALVVAGVACAKDVEFRLESAFLKTESTVGAFDNGSGSSPNRGAKVSQEMDSMESLKFSLVKPLNDNVSMIGSLYTPMNGTMSPKHILSVTPSNDDSYGVAGKFKMLLAQLGGEYTIHLSDTFHPFLGAGLAYLYFYDGGTDSILNPGGHAIKDFNIDNTLTGYLTAGANYNLSKTFSLTGSISYIPLENVDASYQFSTYLGYNLPKRAGRDELDLKINPLIFTLGASWSF
ncbi:MAG: OmpW family protein [Endozoicomonadaceae bacterium]|nr:OmpW family protein [Endozoicomonadaceae bacterium]